MSERVILLVEDNPDGETLTLQALKKNNIFNEVVVAHDGEEVQECLFGTKKYEGREVSIQPRAILPDLQLPKINGRAVLKRLRADKRTMLQPVVILVTSSEEMGVVASDENGTNSYIRKPVDFNQFIEAVEPPGLYWPVLNEAPAKRREN